MELVVIGRRSKGRLIIRGDVDAQGLHRMRTTLGHLLALHVTPANAEDCGEVERLARTVQAVTDDTVEIAWVDQGYTGERAAKAAAQHGIALEVVKLPEAKRGFVLLPDAGSSSGHSPGQLASDGSLKITSDTPKHLQDFTSSLSPAS